MNYYYLFLRKRELRSFFVSLSFILLGRVLDPCLNGATCIDDINKFNCLCPRGFDGIRCEIDINYCANNPCLHGGTCTDFVNSYVCTCLVRSLVITFCFSSKARQIYKNILGLKIAENCQLVFILSYILFSFTYDSRHVIKAFYYHSSFYLRARNIFFLESSVCLNLMFFLS